MAVSAVMGGRHVGDDLIALGQITADHLGHQTIGRAGGDLDLRSQRRCARPRSCVGPDGSNRCLGGPHLRGRSEQTHPAAPIRPDYRPVSSAGGVNRSAELGIYSAFVDMLDGDVRHCRHSRPQQQIVIGDRQNGLVGHHPVHGLRAHSAVRRSAPERCDPATPRR